MAKQEKSKPDPLSPEWTDYVMGLFEPKELIDGNPLTFGLRRVAELLVGEIISSKPTQVIVSHPPGIGLSGKTTVQYEVQFLVTREDGTQYVKTFADVADTWEANTDDMFLVHGSATASTKAEGRALRKALKIKAVAAEELTKKDASKYIGESSDQVEERISKDQINFINRKCQVLDIDVMKFINSGDKFYQSIYEVKKGVASKMIQRLSEMTNNKSLIVEGIKGYKEDWNK